MTYEETLAWVRDREVAIEAQARAGDPAARVVTYRLTEARRGSLTGVARWVARRQRIRHRAKQVAVGILVAGFLVCVVAGIVATVMEALT